jgi:hypothetical protein
MGWNSWRLNGFLRRRSKTRASLRSSSGHDVAKELALAVTDAWRRRLRMRRTS